MMALLRKRKGGKTAFPKKLFDWLITGLKQGHSSDDIAKQLEEAGYTKEQIGEAMSHPEVVEIIAAELVLWVKESLKSGSSREEIARQLEEAGYTKEQIGEAMSHPEVKEIIAAELVLWVKESLKSGSSRVEIARQLEETGYTKQQILKVMKDKKVKETLPDELTRWLTDGLKEGYSPKEMRKQLEQAGYTQKHVKKVLRHSHVRRASRIWTGKDSTPRHEVLARLFRGIAITVFVLLLAVFILNRIPVSTTLWPSTLVSETGLNEEAAVPLTSEKELSAVIAFKEGERHTLDIRASALDISRLDLELDGAKIVSADISSHEPEVYHLKFTPEQAIGLLTLKSDGDIIIYELTYKRPRKLFNRGKS